MPAKLIDEPIEVIAHFDEKEIHPLRFKWKDNVCRISEVWNTYNYEEKQSKQTNFHVHIKGDSNTDYQPIWIPMLSPGNKQLKLRLQEVPHFSRLLNNHAIRQAAL